MLLVTANGAPTRAQQLSACQDDNDLIVDVGSVGLPDLPKKLLALGVDLGPGDKIKLYDLSCLPIALSTLLQLITKLLRMGVAIELCRPGITISPSEQDDLYRMLVELDRHWRHIHGLKRQAHESRPGRKTRIADDRLPEIQRLLSHPGATVATVAKDLGVGRTTLFTFLQRHKEHAPSS